MIVRRATLEDWQQYVTLAQAFHEASPMHNVVPFDPVGYMKFYKNALVNEDVGIWLAESDDEVIGICGAMSYPLYFNPSATVVQELWWWLIPSARGSGAGGQMFKQIEQWADEKKATALFMIALEDKRAKKMENLYARAGFRPLERTFIKEVSAWQ